MMMNVYFDLKKCHSGKGTLLPTNKGGFALEKVHRGMVLLDYQNGQCIIHQGFSEKTLQGYCKVGQTVVRCH